LQQIGVGDFWLLFEGPFDFQPFRQANEASHPKRFLIQGVKQSATDKARGAGEQNFLW
jgi:hypothetical protein